jgi:hypothetical protein
VPKAQVSSPFSFQAVTAASDFQLPSVKSCQTGCSSLFLAKQRLKIGITSQRHPFIPVKPGAPNLKI